MSPSHSYSTTLSNYSYLSILNLQTHCIIKSTIMKTAILLFALAFVTEVQAIHLRIGDGGADPTSNIANLKKRPDSQA